MANVEYVPGTLVPTDLVPLIGLFVVRFSAMEGEMNQLIWHVAGLDETTGRAFTASILNYRPRATLLEWLSPRVAEIDRAKIKTLAHEFMRVADYRLTRSR